MALLMLVGPKCCWDIVRIVLSKCYERKILVYVVVVMFACLILGKYPAAKVIRRWEMNYYTRLDLLG